MGSGSDRATCCRFPTADCELELTQQKGNRQSTIRKPEPGPCRPSSDLIIKLETDIVQ